MGGIKKIILFVAILAFLVGAAVISYNYQNNADPGSAQIKPGGAVSSATPATSQTAATPKEATAYHGQALEFLGEPAVLAKYPPEYVAAKRKQLASVVELIKKSPLEIVNWMDLGLIKKNFDNFTGSRDAWEYVAVLNPKDALNYYNLGNLYSAYLHNLARAERAYLMALQLEHGSEYTILGLADFYKDFYQQKSDEAEAVLLAGLKQIPNSSIIALDLALYYQNKGDSANAVRYFEYFLRLPNATDLQRQQVQDEIAKLKQ